MTYKTEESAKGKLAIAVFEADEKVSSYQEFSDLIMSSPSDTTVVPKERITESFFELKSGLAGDVLQKVSTYRKRVIIEGDFGSVQSKSLTDFIRESNRTGKVVFVDSLEAGIALLK